MRKTRKDPREEEEEEEWEGPQGRSRSEEGSWDEPESMSEGGRRPSFKTSSSSYFPLFPQKFCRGVVCEISQSSMVNAQPNPLVQILARPGDRHKSDDDDYDDHADDGDGCQS